MQAAIATDCASDKDQEQLNNNSSSWHANKGCWEAFHARDNATARFYKERRSAHTPLYTVQTLSDAAHMFPFTACPLPRTTHSLPYAAHTLPLTADPFLFPVHTLVFTAYFFFDLL